MYLREEVNNCWEVLTLKSKMMKLSKMMQTPKKNNNQIT